MQIIKFNISKPSKYTGRDGQEKTHWNNVGTITEFHKDNGTVNRIIEIPAIGLEASIFPVQERDEVAKPKVDTNAKEDAQYVKEATIEYPSDEINPADIPF